MAIRRPTINTPTPAVTTPTPAPTPAVITPKPAPTSTPVIITPTSLGTSDQNSSSDVSNNKSIRWDVSPSPSSNTSVAISADNTSPTGANTSVSALVALFENILPKASAPTGQENISPQHQGTALLSDFGQARLVGNSESSTRNASEYDSMPGLVDMPSDWGNSDISWEGDSNYDSMPELIDMPSDWGQSSRSLEGDSDNAGINNRGLLNNSAGIIDAPSEQYVKSVNTRLLEKTGLAPSTYSSDFIASQDVYVALNKKLNTLPADASDDAIKKEMKNSVNELNLKYLQDKPLTLNVSLSDPDALNPIMNKLQESLSALPLNSEDARQISTNLQNIQNTLETGSLESNTAMVKELDNLVKLADKKGADPALKEMKTAVEGLSGYLKSDIAVQIKDDIKAQLAEQYQHLLKAGAQDVSTFDLRLSFPAGPLLTLGVQGQQVSSFETGNNLDIAQNDKKTGQLMLNFGVHSLASIGVGAGVRVDQKQVFGGIDKMLDFNADQVFSQLVRAPLSQITNSDSYNAMTQLRDLVGDQNNARNHNDRLEADLKAMGWIQESDTLAEPTVHQKTKLDDRTEIRTRMRTEATVGTADGLVAGTIRSDAENMIGVHNKRVPMLSAMLATPGLLENKQNMYGKAPEIEKLTQDVNAVIDGFSDDVGNNRVDSRADYAQLAMSTRETLKAKIEENLMLLESYSGTVRNRDDNASNRGGAESAYANVKQALTGTARDMDTQGKHELEKSLGTKGRQQTLDALTTHHASYLKLYQELENSSSIFTKPISTEQTYSSSVNALDLAASAYQSGRPDSQFNEAIASMNNRFESPSMYLNDKDLTASQATKQATIHSTHQNTRAELNVVGQRIVMEGKHTNLENHPDIMRDGKIDNYVLRGITELSSSSIEQIVNSIKGQTSEESALAIGDALASVTPEVGGRGEMNIEFEFKEGNLMYTRVNLANEKTAGGALDITGVGGVGLTGTSRNQTPVFEKIATESLYYPQLQFNGLKKSERVSGEGDDWSKFAQEQRVPFTELISKLNDANSTPFQEMASMREALKDKAENGKISESTMQKMDAAFDSLKNSADAINNKSENGSDNLSAPLINTEEFNKAINDFRTIFTEYRKSVIDPAKVDRQPIVSEEGNNNLLKNSLGGGVSHVTGLARDAVIGQVSYAADLIREHRSNGVS